MGFGVVRDDDVVGGGGGIRVKRDDQGQPDQRADDLGGDEAGRGAGAIPAKVSENIRPTVTAGLAIIWTEVKDGPPPV